MATKEFIARNGLIVGTSNTLIANVITGNVGVGTLTTSTYRIDVNGTVNSAGYYVNGSLLTPGGGASVSVSTVAPGSPTANSLWWNSNTGRLLIYYNDGDSSQWVDAAPVGEPGPTGLQGTNASVTVGTTTIIQANQSPTVTNSGTTQNAILDFNLPRAYNVTIGTTTTGTPGSSASVTNSGNTTDILLNFTIPAGNTGNTGPISPKSLSILSPLAGDMVTMFMTNAALTLIEVDSVLVGGTTPTANFHVAFGQNRTVGTNVFTTGCITGNTTFGQSNTSFNNSAIAANSYVWVIINSVTGSPTEFATTLRFSA